jgi:hypothetical protein
VPAVYYIVIVLCVYIYISVKHDCVILHDFLKLYVEAAGWPSGHQLEQPYVCGGGRVA